MQQNDLVLVRALLRTLLCLLQLLLPPVLCSCLSRPFLLAADVPLLAPDVPLPICCLRAPSCLSPALCLLPSAPASLERLVAHPSGCRSEGEASLATDSLTASCCRQGEKRGRGKQSLTSSYWIYDMAVFINRNFLAMQTMLKYAAHLPSARLSFCCPLSL